MSDAVKPALTPEEWAHERLDDPTRGAAAIYLDRHKNGAVHFVVQSHDTWRGERFTGAWPMYGSRPMAIMALANAALPEGDPRKLTWQTVDALRSYLGVHYDDPVEIEHERLLALTADRIAALLPPRAT